MSSYIALFLKYIGCGLVTTVTTAWISAGFSPPRYAAMYATEPAQSYLKYLGDAESVLWIVRWEGLGLQVLQYREFQPSGSRNSDTLAESQEWLEDLRELVSELWSLANFPTTSEILEGPFGRSNITVWSVGWPAKCFEGLIVRRLDPNGARGCVSGPATKPAERIGVCHANISMGGRAFHAEFPYHPLWWGLIVNVIVWAAGLWSVAFAASALRRRISLRRGVCPNCKYPIGVSEVCTECGAELAEWAILRAQTQRPKAAR